MDENLKLTIQKIRMLSEQNEEFRTEMQKLFGNTVSATSFNLNDERLTHIEKYLGLDYYVDSMPSLIDYSYINDPEVRAQLISDNREMLRFRYGTRFHSIKFDEYCRYAQLQAEMLINYYYYKVDGDMLKIIEHIKEYNPSANIKNSVKSLGEIPFIVKLWAFEKQFDLNIFTTFDHVRRMRNEQSHRSPDGEDFSIQDYQEKLKAWHIQFNEEGLINRSQLDQFGNNMYESKVKNTPEFKLYLYLLWLKKQPFDKIVESIQRLSLFIKDAL